MVSRAAKLKDLKMPGKPMADEEVEMDLAMEDMEEGEEGLLDEEELDLEGEGPVEEMAELDTYSDEELLAEMQKRGLMEVEEEEGDDFEEVPENELEV